MPSVVTAFSDEMSELFEDFNLLIVLPGAAQLGTVVPAPANNRVEPLFHFLAIDLLLEFFRFAQIGNRRFDCEAELAKQFFGCSTEHHNRREISSSPKCGQRFLDDHTLSNTGHEITPCREELLVPAQSAQCRTDNVFEGSIRCVFPHI